MSDRHTNEDDAPRDAGDEALDALLAGADADLQDSLHAALNVDAGLTAIVRKEPRPLADLFSILARSPLVGAFGADAGTGPSVGARGRAGMGGLGSGAGIGFAGAAAGRGGRGQDAEDEEHKRLSYLAEVDPVGVFSDEEPCAPPVIGED